MMPQSFARVELATASLAASRAFYGTLLGLRTSPEPLAPVASPYEHLLAADGRALGGVYELSTEAQKRRVPSHWCPGMRVDAVDPAVARAVELGATLVQAPFRLFPGGETPRGRLALLHDPQGAPFQIYEYGEGERPLTVEPAWQELATPDLDRAVNFYTELFGWRVVETIVGPLTVAVLAFGDVAIASAFATPKAWKHVPAHWLPFFSVQKLAASIETAERLGARLMMPSTHGPVAAQHAVLADPVGAAFGLRQIPAIDG